MHTTVRCEVWRTDQKLKSELQRYWIFFADIFWQNVAVFISRFGVSQGRFTSFLKYFHFCEESIPGVSCSIAQWFVNVIIFMSVSYTEHVDSQHYCNNDWLWVCSYEERLIYFSFFSVYFYLLFQKIYLEPHKNALSLCLLLFRPPSILWNLKWC